MSDNVKCVWRVGEKAAGLQFHYGPLGIQAVGFWCPHCDSFIQRSVHSLVMNYTCDCGARFRLRVQPALEELEPDD